MNRAKPMLESVVDGNRMPRNCSAKSGFAGCWKPDKATPERSTKEGDRPVCPALQDPPRFPSLRVVQFETAALKRRCIPAKAKYCTETDSAQVAQAKDEKTFEKRVKSL